MRIADRVPLAGTAVAVGGFNVATADRVSGARATAIIQHHRPRRNLGGHPREVLIDGIWRPDPDLYELLWEQEVHNIVTDAGRDFLHAQGYTTTPGANGLNYIAFSNDTLTETTASTTLSSEIVANGLARAQATSISHTAGTAITTLSRVFTCVTAPQAAQKAALFTAAAAGTMNHALAFTQRSLQVNDTITPTFTITLG